MGNYLQGLFPIVKAECIAPTQYSFEIRCPEIAALAQPGQFVHILPDQSFSLRRPISICEIFSTGIRIVFETRGNGTELLARKREGDMIDVLGPLGHGFTLKNSDSRVICIGGGIGVPPMLEVVKRYPNSVMISGFRSAASALLQEELKLAAQQTILCTDDGSAGRKGMVTEPLKELLEKQKPEMIYACGPKPMLKAVAELAEASDIPCEVSMEERMGCGVGACLVCACQAKREDGSVYAAHVCKNGPVFSSKEVVW